MIIRQTERVHQTTAEAQFGSPVGLIRALLLHVTL